MSNYKEMYFTLFQRVTVAINELQEAQQQMEEMYISSAHTNVSAVDTCKKENEKSDIGE
ncbi:hypothetical protein [Hespellia stercorisuis]|uniref:Uncharacterized protein n=1 Tax=Hespellia stercorisuis DSM 15480 TaxID=1121950 RepID=A0A1M6I8J1_9FIRM|nr:hypothetical protein [Hespellia stercorisuis]SHJ30742.1 hypothetical protein SAMN02745243_00272 [Hespellia stercorisuis DSM 15480]